MLEAWHLPGLPDAPAEWLEGQTRAGARFRAPTLSGAEAAAIATSVREAALEARGKRSTVQVIDTLSEAAEQLVMDGPAGVAARELLKAELGWDERLVRETLEGMAGTWSAAALTGIVEQELGGPEALDDFSMDPSWTAAGQRKRRAVGPPLVLQVLAGNVPGVAITATIRSLIVRSGVLCKLPEAEPGILPLFARVVAGLDPLLGRCVAATWWPGASFPAAWREWARRVGTAVVYGGDVTVEAVRSSVPADTEVVAYGPKTGIAVVLPDSAPETARSLAHDVCAYDQKGCVSPRIAYVIGDSVETFVDELVAALEDQTKKHPPPEPTTPEAVAIRAARASFEFAGYEAGRSAVRFPGDALDWTILIGQTAEPRTEALPRTIWVHPVPDLETLEGVLRPLEGRIQTLGYSGSEGLQTLATIATRLGVCRVTPFGSIAWPPPDWRHDGRHQLLPLINWTDFEILE